MPPFRLAAALAISSVFLVACGGTDTESSADLPAADPATGSVQTTDEFVFTAPQGWEFEPGLAPQAMAMALDKSDTDGFADNVNVISDDTIADIGDVEEMGKAATTALEGAQATEIEVSDPIQIDGDTAATISSLFSLNGNEYRTLQYAVAHGSKGYVVTFSFSKDVSAGDQKQIAESVLTTWSWTS